MKLVKLTPLREGNPIPCVTAYNIIAMEAVYEDGIHWETRIYTGVQGLYHRVKETPEQIEELINAAQQE